MTHPTTHTLNQMYQPNPLPGAPNTLNQMHRIRAWSVSGGSMFAMLCVALMWMGSAGCSSIVQVGQLTRGGQMELKSTATDGVVLGGQFDTAMYRFDDLNNLEILLVDGSVDDPTQAVLLRMFWQPRAGRTPLDETSNSATIQYFVFADDQVGVYSGGGLLYPFNDPGETDLRASFRDGSLRLSDASDRFADRVGVAMASGLLNAQRDDGRTSRMIDRLRARLRQSLGYPVLVDGDSTLWAHLPNDGNGVAGY